MNESKIEKFDQVGIVVKDIEKTKQIMEKIFNFKSKLNIIEQQTNVIYNGKEANFKLKKIQQNLGDKQLEIVEVIESHGDHIYSDFLKEGREGLHHLGIYTKNPEKLIDQLKKEYDINVIQEGRIGKVKFYYLDTVRFLGFIIELIFF